MNADKKIGATTAFGGAAPLGVFFKGAVLATSATMPES
jgi:hypothetical protein